ncbi:MAG: DUF1015 family protein, partial [Thermoplasmata archaeon]|nr:DUF1015 family protein [Thermoplasmata archaeon]
MVEVNGFKGVRYNPERVDAEKVITPPYDIISPEQRDEFYEKDPHSAIRLILNREEEGDPEGEKYRRSARLLREWLEEGVLVREEQPAIYIYEQEYVHEGETIKRMGFIGAARLHPYEDGVVIPHERTLS